jgi:alpha-L-fucosidase
MLIGIVVDTSGLVPEKDVQLLQAFGREIDKHFAHPVAVTEGSGDLIALTLGKTARSINCLILGEDITKGERIRKYQVDAWLNNQWVEIAEGSSVGHKHIQCFDRISTQKIRLRITESSGLPQVKEFAAFDSGE